MKAIEAVKKLSSLGYRFDLAGDRLRYRYEGQGDPDRGMVLPLLEVVRQNKEDVRYFLKSYCPRCGGCCFAPDYEGRPLCMECDWGLLVELYPGLKLKH
jgi:hypothetical protein